MAGTPKSLRQPPPRIFEDYIFTKQVDSSAGLTKIDFNKFSFFSAYNPYESPSTPSSPVSKTVSSPTYLGFQFNFDGVIYDRVVVFGRSDETHGGYIVLIPASLSPASFDTFLSYYSYSGYYSGYDFATGYFKKNEITFTNGVPKFAPQFTENVVLLCPYASSMFNVTPNITQAGWDSWGGKIIIAQETQYGYTPLQYNLNSFLTSRVPNNIKFGIEYFRPTTYNNSKNYGCRYYIEENTPQGKRFIVRWYSVLGYPTYNGSITSFEVVIYENGTIEYRYAPSDFKLLYESGTASDSFIGIIASGKDKSKFRFRDFGSYVADKPRNLYKLGGYISQNDYYEYDTYFNSAGELNNKSRFIIAPRASGGYALLYVYNSSNVFVNYITINPSTTSQTIYNSLLSMGIGLTSLNCSYKGGTLSSSEGIAILCTFAAPNFRLEIAYNYLTGPDTTCVVTPRWERYNTRVKAKYQWPAASAGDTGAIYTFSPPVNRRKILTKLSNNKSKNRIYDDRNINIFSSSIVNFPTKLQRFYGDTSPGIVERQNLYTYDFLITASVSQSDIEQFIGQEEATINSYFVDKNVNNNISSQNFFLKNTNSKDVIEKSISINSITSMLVSTCSIYYLNQKNCWDYPKNAIITYEPFEALNTIQKNPNEFVLSSSFIGLPSQDYKGFGPVGNFLCSSSYTSFYSSNWIFGKKYVNDNVLSAYDLKYDKTITINENFHPVKDEIIELPIKDQFLLEYATIEIPLAAGPGWFADKTSCVRKYDSLFGYFSLNSENVGFDFGGPAITVSLFNQLGNKPFSRRELILSGTITHSNDNVSNINFSQFSTSRYQVRPEGILSFGCTPNVVIQPNIVNGLQTFTGTVVLNCEPQIGNGLFVRVSQTVTSKIEATKIFNSPTITLESYVNNVVRKDSSISYVNNFGRSAGGLDISGRSIFGGEFTSNQLDNKIVNNPFYNSTGISPSIQNTLDTITFAEGNQGCIFESLHQIESYKYSPYLLNPGDKLILAVSKTRPVCSGVYLPETPIKHDVQLITGAVKITLYGSYVREEKEFHPPREISFGSNEISEVIGNYPVLDQYEVEYKGTYVDSMADDGVEGFLAKSVRKIDGTLGIETGSRGKQYSLLNPIEENPISQWKTAFTYMDGYISTGRPNPDDKYYLITGSNSMNVYDANDNLTTMTVLGVNLKNGTVMAGTTTSSIVQPSNLKIIPQSITDISPSRNNAPGLVIPLNSINNLIPNYKYDTYELKLTYEIGGQYAYQTGTPFISSGMKVGFCLLPVSQSNSVYDPLNPTQTKSPGVYESINDIPTGGGFDYFVGMHHGYDVNLPAESSPLIPQGFYAARIDTFFRKNILEDGFLFRNYDYIANNGSPYCTYIIHLKDLANYRFYRTTIAPSFGNQNSVSTLLSPLFSEIKNTSLYETKVSENNIGILISAYWNNWSPSESTLYSNGINFIKLEYRNKKLNKKYNVTNSLSDWLVPYKENSGNVRQKLSTFVDLGERYYDSMLPSIQECFKIDGKDIVLWERGTLTGFKDPSGGTPYSNAGNFYEPDVAVIWLNDSVTEEYWRQKQIYQNQEMQVSNDNDYWSRLVNNHWIASFPFEEKYANVSRYLNLATTFTSRTKVSSFKFTADLGEATLRLLIHEIKETPVKIVRPVVYIGKTRYVDSPLDDILTTTSLNDNDIAKVLFGIGDYSNKQIISEDRTLAWQRFDDTQLTTWGEAVNFVGNFGANNLPSFRYSTETKVIDNTGEKPNGEIITESVSPVIRGWKYGIYNGLPAYSKAYFRPGRYGQFRDMLEQRQYTKFYLPESRFFGEQIGLQAGVVDVKFVDSEGRSTKPENTYSQNLSKEATSGLPYFDGEARNRSAINLSTLNNSIVNLSADQFGNNTL